MINGYNANIFLFYRSSHVLAFRSGSTFILISTIIVNQERDLAHNVMGR